MSLLDPITVHPMSLQPTEAWDDILNKPGPLQPQVMRFKVKPPSVPPGENKIRVVCVSDTHSLTSHLKRKIPEGDVLIHAGDFTRCGNLQEVREFNKWLATLPHKHKLVIAGNHELSFDPEIHKKMTTSTNQNEDHSGPGGPVPGACALGDHGNISNPLSPRMVYGGRGGNDAHSAFSVSRSASSTKILDLKMGKMNLENAQEFIAETEKEFELGNFNAFTDVVADGDDDDQLSAEDMKKELTNCIYLQDASVELYGLKFYGTPWQPEFGGWAFNLPRGQACLEKWDKIPDDTDILITHTPPVGYGDFCCTGIRAGCVELLNTVRLRVRPKYHVYGHIHEGYGVRSDGKVIFINASICDINYMPTNRPVVFDITMPKGHSKD